LVKGILEDADKIQEFIGGRAGNRQTRAVFQNNYWYNDDRVVKMKRIRSNKLEMHYLNVLNLYLKHQNMWEGGDPELEVEIDESYSGDEDVEDEPENL
jgi:hypothetical protein